MSSEPKVDVKTKTFIKEKLRDYYKYKGVSAPNYIEQREFGFGNDKKIDYRHLAFKDQEQLKKHLVEHSPLYASYSAAYYTYPDARPMQKKAIQGADLIFEFDTECSHEQQTLTCNECLDWARDETVRLIEEFLVPDFGFSKKHISVVFSGSRGFHIHVVNDIVRELSANARREIADYIQARGLDVSKVIRGGATLNSKGWRGRLARAAYEHVKSSEQKKFKDKQHILKKIEQGNYDLFKGAHSFWNQLLNKQVVHFSADVDQSVTMDISRLIRVPSTIHGGSSLVAVRISNLDSFNAFRDAVVFYNPSISLKIVENIPSFTLKDESFGPFEKDKECSLPEYAAMFLLCKGKATIA